MKIERMNERRFDHALVALNQNIYAIGGVKTKTVERYKPEHNKWEYVASTNRMLSDISAAVHKNQIFVSSDDGFEVYHPESNIWEEEPKNRLKKGSKIFVKNGKLYASIPATNEDEEEAIKNHEKLKYTSSKI